MFEGNIVGGLALCIGAVILAPIMMPAVRNVARPLAKAAIKGGIMAYEKGRELISEGAEAVEDIYIEAQAELAESREAAAEPECAPQEGLVVDPT
jgi:hypothetical protein